MEDNLPADPTAAIAAASRAVEAAKTAAVTASTSTELVLGADSAVETKKRLAAAHAKIAHATTAAIVKTEAAKTEIEAMRRELDAKIRKMNAELAPLQKQMERLQEGIGAVNLYLGRDEYIEELRGGDSAPAGTPLHVRQMVLAMDEESALNAAEGGIDFQSIDAFTEWLLSSDDNLNQVIPDVKGVVTIMPRRTAVDYGMGPMGNAKLNEANRTTWWLLRNNERLYLMTTEFSVGERLLPARDEFTAMFRRRGLDGQVKTLTPGSREWLAAEEQSDAATRHYMKVALILQGLVDRTAVFHPLPEGGLNLLDQKSYDDGLVRRIDDDDLALTDGRPEFKEWQKEALSRLDVGQRVIGHFKGYFGRDEHERIHPRHASAPSSDESHTIARRDGNAFYFNYHRTDQVWTTDARGFDRLAAPKNRARYELDVAPYDASYIPVDAVTVEDMRYYIGSRRNRHEYRNLFPALTAAVKLKEDEDTAEAPFRRLLGQAIITAGHHAEDGIDDYTRELVHWWKNSVKHFRPFVGDEAEEAKAQRRILQEAARRAGTAELAEAAEKVAQQVPGAILIAARTGDLVAVEPQPRRYQAPSVPENLWVRFHEFTKTGKLRKTSEWQMLSLARIAGWTVLRKTEVWDSWIIGASPKRHLTDDAIDQLITDIREHLTTDRFGAPLLIKYREDVNKPNPSAAVFWVSRAEKPDAAVEQPHLNFTIIVDGGAGKFIGTVPNWVPTFQWRDDDGAPYTVNYWGELPIGTVVFSDAELIAKDLEIGRKSLLEQRQAQEHRLAVQTICRRIERLWEAAEWETRKARFVEDFGDERLWDGHKKSLPHVQFPRDIRLTPIGQALHDAGVDLDGLTVAEAVIAAGSDADIPDGFADLRFPTAAAGQEA